MQKLTFDFSELMVMKAVWRRGRCEASSPSEGAFGALSLDLEIKILVIFRGGTVGGERCSSAVAGSDILGSTACFLTPGMTGEEIGRSSNREGIITRLSKMDGFLSDLRSVLTGGATDDGLSLLTNARISVHATNIDLKPAHTSGLHHLPCGGS